MFLSAVYYPQTIGLVDIGNDVVSANHTELYAMLPFIKVVRNNAFYDTTRCIAFGMNRPSTHRHLFDDAITHLMT